MKIYLGNKNKEPVYEELDEVENIVYCGSVASGKTTYITRLLNEVVKDKSPDDYKIVIFDSKRIDYRKFKNSPFLLFPITSDESVENFVGQMRGLQKIGEDRINSGNKEPTIIVFIDETSALSYQYKNFVKDISNMMDQTRDTNIHFVIAAQRAVCIGEEVIDAAKTKIAGIIYVDEDVAMMGATSDKPIDNSGDVIVTIDKEKMFLHQEK